MKKEMILGIVRHALTFAGGVLVMKGYVQEQTATELSGAFLTLFGGIWSIVEKNRI
jgi:hypothetical protein